MSVCIHAGEVPRYNQLCIHCQLYLETCQPLHDRNGYALESELDCWLCEGCTEAACTVRVLINL